MLQKLFNPENPLMITMTQITDCIFLSLFWLVGSIPLVTLGASSAALYDAVFRCYRQGEKHPWQRFFQVYRQNLAGGIVPSAVFLASFAVLVKCMVALWNAAATGWMSWMLFSAGALVGVLVLGILSVLFPMLSRFDNRLGALLKNTLLLSMANLPRTLVLGMANAACVFLCAGFLLPLFFLPVLTALIGSLLIEPMFRPYMNPPETAAE